MATVVVRFDVDGVPVVTGDVPPNEQTPISNPTPTGHVTNKGFIVAAGMYCYGLQTGIGHAPLWRVVQAVDGEETEVAFRRTAP